MSKSYSPWCDAAALLRFLTMTVHVWARLSMSVHVCPCDLLVGELCGTRLSAPTDTAAASSATSNCCTRGDVWSTSTTTLPMLTPVRCAELPERSTGHRKWMQSWPSSWPGARTCVRGRASPVSGRASTATWETTSTVFQIPRAVQKTPPLLTFLLRQKTPLSPSPLLKMTPLLMFHLPKTLPLTLLPKSHPLLTLLPLPRTRKRLYTRRVGNVPKGIKFGGKIHLFPLSTFVCIRPHTIPPPLLTCATAFRTIHTTVKTVNTPRLIATVTTLTIFCSYITVSHVKWVEKWRKTTRWLLVWWAVERRGREGTEDLRLVLSSSFEVCGAQPQTNWF